MNKWNMVKLSDIFTLQMGKTPSRDNNSYWNGSHKWISISDLGKNKKYIYNTKEFITDNALSETGIKVTPKNTVIMSFKLSIGKTAITTENIYTNEAIMSFIDNGRYEIDLDYIYHLFSGKDWNKGTNKAVMGITLNKATLSQIKIPLPPLDIQKQIASNLDKVSHTINICNAILEKMDLLVKSRFVEMFGELGTDKFGWGLEKIGNVSEINPKKAKDNRLYSDLEVSFVPMTAVSEKGDIDTSEIKTYDEVKKGFTYFAENDILFAKITPCMENGKGCIAHNLYNGIGFGSTEFHVLRPSEKINSYWLYTITTFKQFRENAYANMTGSAGQKRVPAKFLENYKIAVPPPELQQKFSDFVEHTEKSKLSVKKILEKAEMLKKALIQEYFGEC